LKKKIEKNGVFELQHGGATTRHRAGASRLAGEEE